MNEKSLKLANYTPINIESLLPQYEEKIINESNRQVKLKEEKLSMRLKEIEQKQKLEEKQKSKRKEKLRKSSKFETIQSMEGYEFEEFTAELLIELGFKDVIVTKKTGDFGVDVLGTDPKRKKTAIQCKRNSVTNKVGLSAIQEVHTAKSLENCSRAIVITTSSFTSSAITAAKKLDIELWDGDYLSRLINDEVK
jgi:HJR/Mrr/RecB family endonuclease